MRKPILAPHRSQIEVVRITGPDPRGKAPRERNRLTNAVRLHAKPRLSFAGVESVGDDFVGSCLAGVLLFATRIGHPAIATALSPTVSERLDANLRQVGALLPDHDRNVLLGASDSLVTAYNELRRGHNTASTLAAAMGASESAAMGELATLAHWGIGPTAKSPIPIAA